jgi:hypothetical protein
MCFDRKRVKVIDEIVVGTTISWRGGVARVNVLKEIGIF